MRRLALVCEGQTEERFVKELLAPHLLGHGVLCDAMAVCTKSIGGRRVHRGGHGGNYDFLLKDILIRLRSDRQVVVSTLFDLYALPKNFPGQASGPGGDCHERAARLERALGEDVQARYLKATSSELPASRFVPNLVLHEFEGLLFSGPEEIQALFPDLVLLDPLRAILGEFPSPEEIDDGPETAPSRRLRDLCPGYDKRLHGPQIAARIGLARIRRCCRHFDRWLRALEGTG